MTWGGKRKDMSENWIDSKKGTEGITGKKNKINS